MSDPADIRTSDLFSHFEPTDLDNLISATSEHHVARGAAPDAALGTCFLRRGELRMQRDTPYGPYRLRQLAAGELLREAHLLQLSPGNAEIVALSDASLLALDREALSALLEATPRFHLSLLWSLWKSLSTKLRKANGKLSEFFTPDSALATEARPSRAEPEEGFHVDIDAKRGLFAEQRLSNLEINFLTTLSQERRYGRGQAIFHEGEPAETMYVVLDGKVRISKHIPGAGEEALSFLERGAFFGEMALIEKEPRSATAVAHGGDAIVLAIPRAVLSGLLDIKKVSSTRLLRLLCEMLARRLNELDDKLVGWHILSAGSHPAPPV